MAGFEAGKGSAKSNAVQAQWEEIGYTVDAAADIVAMPFDYTIDTAGVVITGIVILGFFIFLVVVLETKYRQVIAERVGRWGLKDRPIG